jgi:hypothetical protein
LPVEIDPESPGCEGVIVPGSGLIIDPLTGQAWGSDELFTNHVIAAWAAWLKENAPPPAPPAPPRPLVSGQVIAGLRPSGFFADPDAPRAA